MPIRIGTEIAISDPHPSAVQSSAWHRLSTKRIFMRCHAYQKVDQFQHPTCRKFKSVVKSARWTQSVPRPALSARRHSPGGGIRHPNERSDSGFARGFRQQQFICRGNRGASRYGAKIFLGPQTLPNSLRRAASNPASSLARCRRSAVARLALAASARDSHGRTVDRTAAVLAGGNRHAKKPGSQISDGRSAVLFFADRSSTIPHDPIRLQAIPSPLEATSRVGSRNSTIRWKKSKTRRCRASRIAIRTGRC